MINFVCWKWRGEGYREEYEARHVNVWADSLRRQWKSPEPIRLICVTDDPDGVRGCETHPLWSDHARLQNPSGKHLPRCYRRLRIFDAHTTAEMDVGAGETVVSVDLDVVFCGALPPLFERDRDAPFKGWKGTGVYHGSRVYNGSIFMFRAGEMQWLWDGFDPERSPREAVQAGYFGSDQGYISHRLGGGAPGWDVCDGVLSYSRDVRHARRAPGPFARVVSFNGKWKPWHQTVIQKDPWVLKHWRENNDDAAAGKDLAHAV